MDNTSTISLPANSSIWTFFSTDMFGRNYCNFRGRASRKEFWSFNISLFLLSFLLYFFIALFNFTPSDEKIFAYIINILTFLPALSLNIRRCHDLNHSGWWIILNFIIYFVPFFKGDHCDNKYGENIYETDDSSLLPQQITPSRRLYNAIIGENFFQLKGRATQLEFFGVWAVYIGIVALLFTISIDFGAVLTFILFPLFILPLWSVTVRRLHDLDISGWHTLFIIPLIPCLFVRGKSEDNRFGTNIYDDLIPIL
ncbi:MAG: DUF805 domain-containing protein [Acetobacter sp.]|nr:DUF805 domain-containing protein [Acetobacter sp.]